MSTSVCAKCGKTILGPLVFLGRNETGYPLYSCPACAGEPPLEEDLEARAEKAEVRLKELEDQNKNLCDYEEAYRKAEARVRELESMLASTCDAVNTMCRENNFQECKEYLTYELRDHIVGCFCKFSGRVEDHRIRRADAEAWMKELEEENAKLREWVSDLQSGMYISCVYCGHRYGPRETTPATAAEALKQHVERCPEHPMSKLREEKDRLTGIIRRWLDHECTEDADCTECTDLCAALDAQKGQPNGRD